MTGPGASALYPGEVMHRRLRPRRHVLRYRIVSLLFDPGELSALGKRLHLFSRGSFNLFSIRERDFGDGSGDLAGFAARLVAQAGLDFVPGPVRILAMPRVLGFAFNPLVTWFLHDAGGALRAVLYEVNNTFGERHHYLLPVPPGTTGAIRQDCAKAFHVSPFLPMELHYAFRVVLPGQRLAVAITVADGHEPLLAAVHTARRQELTDGALARSFAAFPLVTLKVVAAILWEAARLWVKRVPVHRHPARAAMKVK